MTPSGKKERIAILGGGVAGLTTAFALTSQPDWQARYEITIYEQGHRLGGKCASVRDPEKNCRVEEHGPHLWFGFYCNSFGMLRDAFQYCREHNLTPESPFQDWPDVFEKKDGATVMEFVRGEWLPWKIELPETSGTPVDARAGNFWDWFLHAASQLVEHLNNLHPATRPQMSHHRALRWLYAGYRTLTGSKTPAPADDWSVLDAALSIVERLVKSADAKPWWRGLGRWVAGVLLGRYIQSVLRDVRPMLDKWDDLRHGWYIADLLVAGLRGMIAADVFARGLDAIEGLDFSHWLEQNGAADPWSPLVRAMYDTQAEYTTGETAPPDRPDVRPADADLAAGTAIHCFVRIFAAYSGAFTYKTKAGMGECLITPIYLALRHRGVRFAFFHRVKQLRLTPAGSGIAQVELDVQAAVSAGAYAYEPLIGPVRGVRCWPKNPLYEQLADGAAIRAAGANLNSTWCVYRAGTATLEGGRDFDKLVLAIPSAALPAICSELSAAAPAWKRMLEALATVQTQFWAVWMKRTTAELSVQTGQPITECAAEPIDSWLDMSQVLDWEEWPATARPASLHYFEGPLPLAETIPPAFTESDFQARQDEHVRGDALRFFRQNALALWSKAGRAEAPGQFDWGLMAGAAERSGEDRFLDQYWRANVDPAERFGLSTANSKFCRLRPDGSGFAGLYLAGDWTLNGLNAGAVEAAVISALACSRAVSGYPRKIAGGYQEMEK